jgi:hypothetical protein
MSTSAVDINYSGAPRNADGTIRVFQDRRHPVKCLVCGQRFVPGPDDPIATAYWIADPHRELQGICSQHKLGPMARMAMDHALETFRKDGVACMNALSDAARFIKKEDS